MLGLDGAGKTTILHRFKQRTNNNTTATVGFNVETIRTTERKGKATKDFSLTLWDVGGQGGPTNLRHLWEHHITSQDFQGLVYVVDCADKERLPEAKEELFTRVLAKPETEGIPLLVIANKQDQKGAVTGDELALHLGLTRHLAHPWCIHEASAKTSHGLAEVLDKMHSLTEKPVCVPTSRFYR